MNGTVVKNQLIFDFASGSLGPAKSIFASTYLYLNSKASKIYSTFENIMGDELVNNHDSELKNVKYSDCMFIKQTESKSLIQDVVALLWNLTTKSLKEYTSNR